LGRGTSLTPQIINWAQRRLAQQGVLIFEPWVERLAEVGIQLEIPAAGEAVLLGVTPLLTDRSGSYRGSRFDATAAQSECWREAAEVGLRVARRLQELGYFGPLGLDAMSYRGESAAVRLRPLQDLNARYTMGRLSLGFRRLLSAGQSGAWLHFAWAGREPLAIWLEQFSRDLPPGSVVVPTSPLGQTASRGSVVLIAPSEEICDEIQNKFFAALP
jgi:hypothetical protein